MWGSDTRIQVREETGGEGDAKCELGELEDREISRLYNVLLNVGTQTKLEEASNATRGCVSEELPSAEEGLPSGEAAPTCFLSETSTARRPVEAQPERRRQRRLFRHLPPAPGSPAWANQ